MLEEANRLSEMNSVEQRIWARQCVCCHVDFGERE
jgi:hypothetical protein